MKTAGSYPGTFASRDIINESPTARGDSPLVPGHIMSLLAKVGVVLGANLGGGDLATCAFHTREGGTQNQAHGGTFARVDDYPRLSAEPGRDFHIRGKAAEGPEQSGVGTRPCPTAKSAHHSLGRGYIY